MKQLSERQKKVQSSKQYDADDDMINKLLLVLLLVLKLIIFYLFIFYVMIMVIRFIRWLVVNLLLAIKLNG